ncbi:olfactory receptor 52E8-like [Protopterus annectens]|uniref:olfactory receptor 52E8-like n=1 Tax=Protopterus annectens TaxID=7888 RepID=UPI001CFB3356|nr:olfactory receptor 52E8-like [Protopterus annectens]
MLSTNQCSTQDLEIILTGFPGLQDIQFWISAPFFVLLVVTLFGNLTLLLIIATEQSLHEPMYYFILILSAVDLVTGLTLLPQTIAILWFGSLILCFDICLLQMFFIYFSVVMESSVLVLMAYDRYTAICNPLRYSSIITNTFILNGSLIVTVRSFCIIFPGLILFRDLPFQSKTILSNVYCEYLTVIDAACVSSDWKDILIFLLFILAIIPDTLMIFISYYMIVSATLKLKSKVARLKAFNTCSSHFFVILSFYLSGPLSVIIYIFQNKVPAYTRALFPVLYYSVPPALNPLIYGIRTKEIFRLVLTNAEKIKNVLYTATGCVSTEPSEGYEDGN